MRKNIAISFLFIAAVVIAAAIAVFAFMSSPKGGPLFENDAEPFTSGWRTSDGRNAALPGIAGDGIETVLLRELPEALPDDAVLLLKTSNMYVTAEIEGSEVYSWTDDSKALFGDSFGLPCYAIRLPPSAAGRMLELHLTSSGGGENLVYNIALGSALSLASLLLRQDLYAIALFLILLFASVLFAVFVVILRKRVTLGNGNLYLIAFMLLLAVRIISGCDVTLLITRSAASANYSAVLSLMLLGVPMLLHVQSYLGRKGTVLSVTAFLILLNFSANVLILAAGLEGFTLASALTRFLLFAAFVTAAFMCILEYVQTKNRDVMKVFIGVGLLFLFSLAAFIKYYVTGSPDVSLLINTGLAAFALTIAAGALIRCASELIKSNGFQSMTALTPSGICKFENFETSAILYANEFYYRMFGYTERQAKEAGFTTAYFTVLPCDLGPMKEKIKKYFAVSLDRFETEARHVTKSGDIIWVLSRYRLDPNKSGEVTSVMIDITDRKLMEEQLRIREEEYRIATRHSNKMILRFDVVTKTCHRQPGAEPDFGLPQTIENFPDVLINSDLVSHDSIPAIRTMFDLIYKGEPEGSIIVSIRDRDNEEYRWYHFDFTSIFDSSGKPVQAIISYYDITLQRQKELAFQRWQQSYNAIPKSATNYYEYNLTGDIFEHEEGEMLPPIPEEVPRKLSKIAEYIANHYICPEDINSWLQFMSRDRLLDHYTNNKNAHKFDFRRLSGQDTLWTTVSVQLIPDPYSSDVKAYFLLEDIDDRKQAELHLKERSMRDSLTGLLNRGSFIEQFNEVLRKSHLETQHALVMLDIDNFKRINDTLGHSAGDSLLVSVANNLKFALRADDLCGRLGGDEFVICLRHTNLGKPLETRVSDLCNLICNERIWGVPVSASFGIAGFPYDGLTFEELYKKADVALYTAKSQGRGCYALYDPQLSFDDLQATNTKHPVLPN